MHAGSGSHNLDAPYLARQRCRGCWFHQHLWGQGPFRFGGGRRLHEEQIEAKHTSSLPSFGALRRDNTPTAACLILLSSCSRERAKCFLAYERVEPPLHCAWASFYTLKGVTDRWQHREGYKCKKRGGWYSYLYSAPYLTLTAGDKGIKGPSESPNSAEKDR